MIKKVLLTFVVLCCLSSSTFAQRGGQKIGYVDLEYILENIPEYAQAQNQLDQKVIKWQQKLDKLKKEIETMKIDLSNEKALLTDDLIEERLEDIAIVEQEFKKTEMAYFSSDGDLFFYRKLLVKPIQDQVYNAVQEIGQARGYEIIFDKSSDLIMLYTSKKADISELVLKSILRTEKVNERNKKTNSADTPQTRELTEEEQKAVDERDAKRQAALDKADKAKTDRAKKREDQKAEIEKKRLERLKQREDARQQLKDNKEKKDDNNN